MLFSMENVIGTVLFYAAQVHGALWGGPLSGLPALSLGVHCLMKPYLFFSPHSNKDKDLDLGR